MKSQNEKLLAHLKRGYAIDPLTALSRFGIMRLASRIYDLRQIGFEIKAKKADVTNRFGDIVRICIYRLEKA